MWAESDMTRKELLEPQEMWRSGAAKEAPTMLHHPSLVDCKQNAFREASALNSL
jgi:hypothetical protein